MRKGQIYALQEAARLGSVLQTDHPEIKDLFLSGSCARGISRYLGIPRSYGTTTRISNVVVRFCLKGYCGEWEIDPYLGLVSLEEYASEVKRQRRIISQRVGGEIFRDGKGIFSLNEEQRAIACSKAGRAARDLKRGICALTTEDRRILGASSGRASVIAKGLTPWEPDHIDLVRKLVAEGKSNRDIASYINSIYFDGKPVRNTDSVYNLRRNRFGKNQ